MPIPPSKARNAAGPWVIVLVPMKDEDPAFPSRRRFYVPGKAEAGSGVGPGTEHLHLAHQFDNVRTAQSKANSLMHTSRNVWAVVVPHAIVWALLFSKGASWKPRIPKEASS